MRYNVPPVIASGRSIEVSDAITAEARSPAGRGGDTQRLEFEF